MATRVTLTYLDYAALLNDGRRYEVHEGELAVTPAPGPVHQEFIGNLFALLQAHGPGPRLAVGARRSPGPSTALSSGRR
jgi:hypothetical protein